MTQRWLSLSLVVALAVCAGNGSALAAGGGADWVTPLPIVTDGPADMASGFGSDFALLDGQAADRVGWSVYGARVQGAAADMWGQMLDDQRDYYSIRGVGLMAAGFGVAAALANSDMDPNAHHWVQDDTRSWATNHTSEVVKVFGNGAVLMPVMGLGWIGGAMLDDRPMGEMTSEWGDRCMRSLMVGAPPMLVAQWVTGGSRPYESRTAADWKPFNDNNGVSGHAFMGALPFINAAKMTDNWAMKAGYYACSALPAWSRVNDNAHYPSQALLGWWMAYCAATAVDADDRDGGFHVVPLPMLDGAGLGLSYSF